MTEIHIHGPVTFITAKETPAKVPSAPPRPVPKPPTDNGGRLISWGTGLPGTSAAKRDSSQKPRWRFFPASTPPEGKDILMCFEADHALWTYIAYRIEDAYYEPSELVLFPGARRPERSEVEIIFDMETPEFKWIPLDELLKGVE